MPASRLITSLALAAFVLPVAACGEAEKGLLTNNQATELLDKVELAEKALDADEGGCQTVARRAEEGIEVANSQNGVSTELRNNIIQGFQRVADRAELECEPDEPEKTATPTPTAEPTEVPTEEPTEEPTPTAEPTEEPTPEPTPEPTEEIPTPEPTEDETGSVLAPETGPR